MSDTRTREPGSSPRNAVEECHYINAFACDTRAAFQSMSCGPIKRSLERDLLWSRIPDSHMDGTQPAVRLIVVKRGSFHEGITYTRTQLFLCVQGSGNVILEMFDKKCNQHFRSVVPFASQFTDSLGVPPSSSFRFQADPLEDLHLIAVEPSHCWPDWIDHPDYVNPGELQNTDFRRNYEGLSQMGDREPTPFFTRDVYRRARRHRIWGRDVLPEGVSGERDFVKPFTHLVLYTFFREQMNFEHYHPHSWEFVYCIQGEGSMRLREFRGEFDPKDVKSFPYRPKAQERGPECPGSSSAIQPSSRIGSQLNLQSLLAAQTAMSRRESYHSPAESRRREKRRRPPVPLGVQRAPESADACVRDPREIDYPVDKWGENWTSWAKDDVTEFKLYPGLVVLVPKTWLHHYEGNKRVESDELLLTYAMQTPQPIMHLLEHEANGWNAPPHRDE